MPADVPSDRSSAVDFDWPGWVLAQVGTASTVGFARKAVERVMAEVVPMMAERDRLQAELERLKRDPRGSLHEDKAEIRRLRAENERLKTSLALFAERIERDRRQPDKILCYVLDMRRASDETPASCETCAGSGAQLCECDKGERPIQTCFSCSGRDCADCGGTGLASRDEEARP